MKENLENLSVDELEKLQPWMVPPSRKRELEDHLRKKRRREIAIKDKSHIEKRGTKPGERMDNEGNLLGPIGSLNENKSMQAQPRPELKNKENSLQKLEEILKNFLLRLQEIGESELDDIAHEIRSDIDFYKALYSRDKEETTWLEAWSDRIEAAIIHERKRKKEKAAMKGKQDSIKQEKIRQQDIQDSWIKNQPK